ncbi:MAG: DUF6906 family protein [Lachnospiraceae bacterium]
MRQGKKLTRNQKELLEEAVLEPLEWRYHYEDKQYLHIKSAKPGARNIKINDKENRKSWSRPKQTKTNRIRDETYTFGDITRIMAANGGGKSTIATGWFWLFVDRDYALHSNPNVVPLGVEECLPRVEATLDIDGVEVVIAKQQKITTGNPDSRGISKITTSNTYEINSVPKTERDFRADMEEKGFNFEKSLIAS